MKRPLIGRSSVLPALGLAALSAAIILAIHHQSPRTLVSAHGLLHTAIADQFRSSAWPIAQPENPFFAGERLPYYWFYHYVAARVSAALGVHPLRAFELLGLVAVGCTWLSGAAIGRLLGWSTRASLLIGALALAGANPLGIWILAAKLAAGRPWPTDDGTYLWGLVHPAMGLARWNDPGALYGPLVNFFLNNSSRALALSLALTVLFTVLRVLSRPRGGLMPVAIATAACTAMSPLVGLLTCASLTGGIVLARLWRGSASGWRWSRAIQVAAALGVGAILPWTTYAHLFARSAQPEIVIGFRPDLAATLLLSSGPLLAMAIAGFWRRPSGWPMLEIAVVSATALLVGNTLLAIPGSNESDFSHVAMFLLAIPAAGVVQDGRGLGRTRQTPVMAAVLAVFLPTTALVVWTYWARPPIPLQVDGERLVRVPADDEMARLYEWIQENTPKDAVFIVAPDLLQEAMVGNVPEFPALTGRALFSSPGPDYIVEPHGDLAERTVISQRALSASLSTSDRLTLGALERPAYLLASAGPEGVAALLSDVYGRPVFAVGTVAIYPLVILARPAHD